MYAWGRKRGLIDSNPAAGLGRRAASGPRTRVLTAAELARLWQSTEAPDAWVSLSMRTIIRLAALTVAGFDQHDIADHQILRRLPLPWVIVTVVRVHQQLGCRIAACAPQCIGLCATAPFGNLRVASGPRPDVV